MSLFIKINSISDLCFKYSFSYEHKERLVISSDIYKLEQGNMNVYEGSGITASLILFNIIIQRFRYCSVPN